MNRTIREFRTVAAVGIKNRFFEGRPGMLWIIARLFRPAVFGLAAASAFASGPRPHEIPWPPAAARKPTVSAIPHSPRIVRLDTIPRCPPCEALKGELKRRHVPMVAAPADPCEIPPGAFPTVVYSDGAKDHGERFYRGGASVGTTVSVVTWQPLKRSRPADEERPQ